jgi:hypothetical protein
MSPYCIRKEVYPVTSIGNIKQVTARLAIKANPVPFAFSPMRGVRLLKDYNFWADS